MPSAAAKGLPQPVHFRRLARKFASAHVKTTLAGRMRGTPRQSGSATPPALRLSTFALAAIAVCDPVIATSTNSRMPTPRWMCTKAPFDVASRALSLRRRWVTYGVTYRGSSGEPMRKTMIWDVVVLAVGRQAQHPRPRISQEPTPEWCGASLAIKETTASKHPAIRGRLRGATIGPLDNANVKQDTYSETSHRDGHGDRD
jgi:hypothetical protein